MSSQSYTASSPQPLARDATTIISEDAHSQFPRGTFRDTHRDTAPERRQWARSGRMFWIYDPSSSSSSQDGRSNASSGGNSTRSETSEERRARVVSPYGSFFVEEMEFDAPAESDSSRRREGHTTEAAGSDTRRVLHPLRNLPSRSQATMMAPLLFGMGPPAAHSGYPGTVPPQPVHDAATRVAEIPLSPLSLAENSRRSQPPVSWRQGHVDHPNGSRWRSPQFHPGQVAAASPPGGSLLERGERFGERRETARRG
ncbi:hypothetical protein BC826DRAFT_1007467 [Russula brevipes]|nr:hypothetical protein BC826DRAFT_1007467 [Russula brevipes]